ncbi:exported hypothetical protein [metagenome]|uniref:Uncharacterized protein n=1 Tax=metagenome TaxID=256318 RepID=A0A2P2BXL4_9ZZZZ
MLRRALLSVVSLFVLLTAAVTVVAAPAVAAGSLTADGGTLYEGCRNFRYSFDVAEPGAAAWQLDLTANAPDGSYAAGDYQEGVGESASGSGTVNICSYQGVGRYQLEAQVTYFDADFNTLAQETLYAPLRLTKMSTRTSLSVSDRTPRFNSVVRLVATSYVERPSRFVRNKYEYVALEVRCGTSGWARVRGSKSVTNNYGKTAWRYRWNIHRTCKVRAVTLKTASWTGSSSSAKKVNPVGRSLVTTRELPAPALF